MPLASEDIEDLAEDILADIELGRIPLASVMLKCARLARWLGDENHRQVFVFEAGGYPTTPSGISADVFALGRLAGRVQITKQADGQLIETMTTLSVEAWERRIETNRAALSRLAVLLGNPLYSGGRP